MPQAQTESRSVTDFVRNPAAAGVGNVVSEVEIDQLEITSGLEELGNNKMVELLERQAKAIEGLQALADLPNQADAKRQRAILETDLKRAREEYAKRAQSVGALANQLFSVYDSLGKVSQEAKKLTPEDKALIEQARQMEAEARQALANAAAELESIEPGVAQAKLDIPAATSDLRAGEDAKARADQEKSVADAAMAAALKKFNLFGRRDRAVEAAQPAVDAAHAAVKKADAAIAAAAHKIAQSQRVVDTAQARTEAAQEKVAKAEQAVVEAEQGIKDAMEQVRVNREDRVRNASLTENFKLVDRFTGEALTVLDEDLKAMRERQVSTQKTLDAAFPARVETGRELDAKKDEIERLNRDLKREQQTLTEYPDQKSPEYLEQSKLVAEIEEELTRATGEELQLNTRLMALTAAVEGARSTLAGLTTQIDTAEVFKIKFETGRKAAELMAKNIDQLMKGTMNETGHDALDQSLTMMTVGAVDIGIHAEASSLRLRNETLERAAGMMDQIRTLRDAGDQVQAEEAQRYLELDARLRAGYAERGLDVDMGHLMEAAAEAQAEMTPATDGASEDFVSL